MRALNQCGAWDMEEMHRCIHDLIPNAHPSAPVIPPFHCDHGDRITLGNHTLIGPNSQLLTPDHSHNWLERRKTIETGFPIRIGDDCWFVREGFVYIVLQVFGANLRLFGGLRKYFNNLLTIKLLILFDGRLITIFFYSGNFFLLT